MTTAARTTPAPPGSGQDVQRIRRDFPLLGRTVHGRPLIYLDNAATTQKPQAVLDAITGYYRRCNANVHRGVHRLSQEATEAYERARDRVARWINAPDVHEVVFARGTTEAINLVAGAFGRQRLRAGDEILLTHMEHHSNIVPWQLLAEAAGARIRVLPVDDRGELRLEELPKLLSQRTRIVSVVHVSNALGTINPIRRIADLAHEAGAVVVVDGAQAMPHMRVDVQELGCDFYAFSGHKMYGPTGIGVLWGKRPLLESMPPYQGGGEMIRSVTFERTTYNDPPARFEAGTPNVEGAVGLAAAIDYLETIGMEEAAARESTLLAQATEALQQFPEVRLIGTAPRKTAVVSFVIDGIHPHDVGTVLDHEGIAVRTGHHCTQPLMERFGVAATARASMGLYNTPEEMEALAAGVRKVLEVFAGGR
jgi:cysteine desulfurase/selenocysteine lyase